MSAFGPQYTHEQRVELALAQLKRQWSTPLPMHPYTANALAQACRTFGIPTQRDPLNVLVQS